MANDRNGGRLRLNASRHNDDDDVQICNVIPHTRIIPTGNV